MSPPSHAYSPKGILPSQSNDIHEYKLYKRRFVGLLGMVRHLQALCSDLV